MSARRGLFERLPPGVLPILRELGRVVLRRPVAGILAVARRGDGQLLLIQRGDTGTWALPGGTLEWGETARATIVRELLEEAGASVLCTGRLVGVYSAPERDQRMHAVTIVVEAEVAEALRGPSNPLEVLDAKFFALSALPSPLAYKYDEMLGHALTGAPPYWE
ncbi:MAG TPA: NUDIX hydrolase [Polyangiales bacterium]|nr:NUDIX hydrolase [Polyangiales bacterium]